MQTPTTTGNAHFTANLCRRWERRCAAAPPQIRLESKALTLFICLWRYFCASLWVWCAFPPYTPWTDPPIIPRGIASRTSSSLAYFPWRPAETYSQQRRRRQHAASCKDLWPQLLSQTSSTGLRNYNSGCERPSLASWSSDHNYHREFSSPWKL